MLQLQACNPSAEAQGQRMNKRAIIGAAVAVYASVSVSQAQIITNGSFTRAALTRAALSTRGRAKSNFLSVK